MMPVNDSCYFCHRTAGEVHRFFLESVSTSCRNEVEKLNEMIAKKKYELDDIGISEGETLLFQEMEKEAKAHRHEYGLSFSTREIRRFFDEFNVFINQKDKRLHVFNSVGNLHSVLSSRQHMAGVINQKIAEMESTIEKMQKRAEDYANEVSADACISDVKIPLHYTLANSTVYAKVHVCVICREYLFQRKRLITNE